ncbi:MAG TPA: UDP-N-acetyl-D-mannosamine dehydrogenase [Chitinophagaceae bacterium]|nr:UDP-N-acetyl-D-mannosamine dehydrogenase [Chitinophagaceae bacterium]HNN30445.1 UDP-N-acetyl-D-mannosamine dehydrogenase [Chitinophagaceae bacterium]
MNNSKIEKVCIVGLGYIGLPTAALLANNGYNVHGVDVKENVVNTINKGEIHIVEPELDKYVKTAVNNGNLKASLQAQEADVFIIAVPTPFHEGFKPNIDFVLDAAKKIAPYVKDGNIVILESTSPVSTTEKVAEVLGNNGVDISKIYVAYCPERVLPGKIMKELVENDRIVGGINEQSTNEVVAFYKTFVKGEVLATNARTAEMCKLTENSYRDVNIAFANELSMICDKADINVWELINLANHHPRVKILQPGAGVGGHCIAVDPWFIVSDFPTEAKLIKAGREVNDYKTEWVVEKIKNTALQFELNNKHKPVIACMGLAFKPDIDDLRESPALEIAKCINDEVCTVVCVEPNVNELKGLTLVSLNQAIEQADIICYLVKHSAFKGLKNTTNKIELDFCDV